MGPDLDFLVLLAVTVVWTLLPLLPMFFELYERNDVAPLSVPPRFEGDTAHFATRFRDYIDRQLEEMPAPPPTDRRAYLPDGTPVYVVAEGNPFKSEYPEKRVPASPPRVTVTAVPVMIPAQTNALREVYAQRGMETGANCVFRSVFGEESVDLGAHTCVLRWTHAVGTLHAGPDSQLYGRSSAGERMQIDEGCRFERLYAPTVSFGEGAGASRLPQRVLLHTLRAEVPNPPTDSAGGWLPTRLPIRITGDFQIDAQTLVDGDLIVSGELRVGDGCVVRSCIKGRNGVALGKGVIVEGSVVTEGSLWLREGCTIGGPLIAERDVFIERDCSVGTHELPTTITADGIYIAPAVTVYGTVWARQVGMVTPIT